MKKFEVNKKYYGTSACDHNCIFELVVIARTEKTIKVLFENKTKNLKIHNCDGEFVFPYGQYSLAPVIRAERELI